MPTEACAGDAIHVSLACNLKLKLTMPKKKSLTQLQFKVLVRGGVTVEGLTLKGTTLSKPPDHAVKTWVSTTLASTPTPILLLPAPPQVAPPPPHVAPPPPHVAPPPPQVAPPPPQVAPPPPQVAPPPPQVAPPPPQVAPPQRASNAAGKKRVTSTAGHSTHGASVGHSIHGGTSASAPPSAAPKQTEPKPKEPKQKEPKPRKRSVGEQEPPPSRWPLPQGSPPSYHPDDFPRHARVRVFWGDTEGWQRGTVRDTTRETIGLHSTKACLQITYDDGSTSWAELNEYWHVHLLTPEDEAETELTEVRGEFEELKLQCLISLGRLSDPARGKLCKHPACFNYEQLSRHVTSLSAGRMQQRDRVCPLPLCGQPLTANRQIVRDEWLKEQLQQLPTSLERVWLRRLGTGGPRELRVDSPGSSATASSIADVVDLIEGEEKEAIELSDDEDDAPAVAPAKKPRRTSDADEDDAAGARGMARGTFFTPTLDDGNSRETGIQLSDDDD